MYLHVGAVLVADILADAVVLQILLRIDEPSDMLHTAMGIFGAYVAADLVSALYNWHALNYADKHRVPATTAARPPPHVRAAGCAALRGGGPDLRANAADAAGRIVG